MIWPMARVGDLSKQIRGVTFGKSDAQERPAEGLLPIFTATNVTESGLNQDSVLHLPDSIVNAEQYLRKNDVLITTSSGSLAVVGRSVQVHEDLNAGFGAFCKVLRPIDSIDPGYFAHFFRTPSYRARVSQLAAGANINNLRNEDLNNLEIPLPPLPEQRRIASILDQADAARNARQKSIMLTGTAVDSLFQASARAEVTKRPLGQLVKLSSGRFLPSKSMAEGGSVAVYGGNGVNGRHNEAMFNSPQIVIGRVGAYCGVVHVTEPESWVTDNAMVVTWHEEDFERDYLAAALKNANLHEHASQSGQPLISAARIKGVLLGVPDKTVQLAYAADLARLGSLLKAQRSHLALLDELFSSLQHRAFTGQL